MTVFCSWSGGKESTLALNRAVKEGLEVDCIVNVVPSEGSAVGHGLPPEFYRLQAEGMGLEARQVETDWEGYEENFSGLLREIGPDRGVFGDVYLQDHREWVERKAEELGFEPIEPLWGDDPEDLYREFLNEGFEGKIVKVKPERVSPEWLGRALDEDFLGYLREEGVCPIGENGEYHTATLSGPLFKRKIELKIGGQIEFGSDRIIELEGFRLV
ncbi:hypothetical protein AKJ43_00330 [candidate division MSBL1 archaeon SCGC-AAA261D19]|uniref:Diphthamide synthase domain-containing protein n=1 Tax=candidate division MSBL1 archaeon SCGC-AAA261D19 TaxID=1698273 RepID=A0A133V8U8_9EURY|nr:hypothetical protein AKJ43_00330 [candidate division MSBL1 archaeon SCGC-AAA261D19]